MSDFCHACAISLHIPDARGASELYCKFCTDEQGNLKSRDDVQRGIAGWLKSWQPGLEETTALDRASHFMKAMPAWAS